MSDHVPKEAVGDDVHRLARAALSAIPCVGGAAVELFNRVIAPPLQRRREAWLNRILERLTKMEQEGRISVEELQNNDEFISTVMQASQVAIRNHQQEKLDALRNAVLNTALGQAPEDSKREMFLGLVDTFTVIHLQILTAIAGIDAPGPRRHKFVTDISGIAALAIDIRPELRDAELVYLAVSDLCQRGLLFYNRDGGGVMPIGQRTSQLTDLGQKFLQFITEPKGDK